MAAPINSPVFDSYAKTLTVLNKAILPGMVFSCIGLFIHLPRHQRCVLSQLESRASDQSHEWRAASLDAQVAAVVKKQLVPVCSYPVEKLIPNDPLWLVLDVPFGDGPLWSFLHRCLADLKLDPPPKEYNDLWLDGPTLGELVERLAALHRTSRTVD